MERSEIITKLSKYFSIKELVSEEVYNKYRDDAWALFRTETLHCLLIIRIGIGKSITVNNWSYKKKYETKFDERGYRENLCDIVLKKTKRRIIYISGHVLGAAFDFTVKGMGAVDVRQWILKNENLFPCKIRLENKMNGEPINWVHFDTKYYERNSKVYFFNI